MGQIFGKKSTLTTTQKNRRRSSKSGRRNGGVAGQTGEKTNISAIGAGVGLGGMIVGPIIGGIGAIQEGRTAEAIGKYNRNIAEMQAKEIERKTEFDLQRETEAGARTMSTMEASQAAAGGGMNLLALAKQASELELQKLMTGREGTIAAGQARAEGAMAEWQGKQAKKQTYLQAGGTLLQGFGSAGMAYAGLGK